MKYIRWTKDETNKLIEIYSDEINFNIAKILNKTIDQIERKAYLLKLKKSKKQKSKNIANRNKIVGRDLSYENLKIIAQKYKTRGEFQRLDGSAYYTARVAGYLNDICSHMVTGSYSIPQLILFSIIKKLFNDTITYNEKNIIKPYELDVYIEKYKLGFEYDGKLWHVNKEIDMIKTEICKNKNITLIRLTENNRNYIQDIKKQLIKNIKIINNICNKNFNVNYIINIDDKYINEFINSKIIDEKEIINIISKYDNYHDFKINEFSLYQKLINRGLIDKYTSKLKRNKIYWTEEKVIEEIKKYNKLGEFIKNSKGCYLYIKKNNLNHLIKNLHRTSKFSISDIKSEMEKYDNLKDFREKSPKHYSYVKKNKLYNLIEKLKRLK
jgi:very-short-patch-repair endonuclease